MPETPTNSRWQMQDHPEEQINQKKSGTPWGTNRVVSGYIVTMSQPSKDSIHQLLKIMESLRDPQTGCPWDIEQTFETIAPYTLEEAYEVNDAVARGDMENLKEELGDLLLQVVYHAQMAKEQGHFDFADVSDVISQKMISRHPHVFGTKEEREKGAEPGFWEKQKDKEKGDKPASLLGDVPLALPALSRAVKLQKRAAKVGFDWDDPSAVLDKIEEECAELVEACEAGEEIDKREEEFGDILFVMSNLARHLKLDPEKALRRANEKFISRFGYIENEASKQNRKLSDMSLDEMEALWIEAKTKPSK